MMLMASGVTARGASRGRRPRSTRLRLALGESCRPAPASSSRSAFSRMMTRKPRAAIESAAVSPPIPAPATMMVRATATDRSGGLVLQDAFRRPGFASSKVGGKTVERRAIRADDLVVVAEIEKHVRMVERRIGAHAHELLRADLDYRDAGVVVEMRDDMVRHSFTWDSSDGRTQSTRRGCSKRRAPYWRVQMIPRAPAFLRPMFPKPGFLEVSTLIRSCKFDTILSSERSPSFVGAVVS